VVVGGLVFSQVVTLYLTPVFYVYMEQLSRWLGRRAGRVEEAAAVPAVAAPAPAPA
jgi:HAE1 family hydrophobic/amphiphilic exporter-1